MHRVQWDFRHAGVGTGRGRRGPVAVPGKYTAEIHKFDQGKETLLVKATPFEIQPLLFGDMTSIDRKAIVVFAKKAQALGRQVNKATELWTETGADLEKLVAEISSDPLAEQTQLAALRKLQLEWMDIGEIFNGDPTRSRRNESALPGLSARLRTLTMGAMGSTEGPTDTHKSQYSIVESQLAEANSKLRVVATRVALLIKAREK